MNIGREMILKLTNLTPFRVKASGSVMDELDGRRHVYVVVELDNEPEVLYVKDKQVS